MSVQFPIDGFRTGGRLRARLLPILTTACHRDGNEGFGQGNFRALFESTKADQVRRGMLKAVA
jgi:4-hydroxyphenylpyruvate dioxygenase